MRVTRPARMRAMVLERAGAPLVLRELPVPLPGPGELLLRVEACGVCRTDLHVAVGELARPKLPLVLGHEIVGRVVEAGERARSLPPGTRVGVPWLGRTCGRCTFCRSARENLCDAPAFTGYDLEGGYAEYALCDARYCFRIDPQLDAAHAAPLLCAGLIGHRALRMGGDAQRVGIYGFGAAAHLVAQIARHEGRRVFAFTRPGDGVGQSFARSLGAEWAGGSEELPPVPLESALLFAPAGELVPRALAAVEKGGTVVCGGIHMSPIPSFPYELLWGERVLRSVANLTREDGERLLALAAQIPLRPTVRPYALERANEALADLRAGRFEGAAVLVPS